MQKKNTQDLFQTFLDVVTRLRKDCPWDREQTHQSIRQSLIEEAYEVVEAIDSKNLEELRYELGDLLLHVVLHSIMAEEKQLFNIDDVLTAISEKLIRRHPHVFGDTKAKSAQEVKVNWERIKMSEGRTSVVAGVPKELPALLRATRIQEKASKVGFDWERKEDVWNKVQEEINELHSAESGKDKEVIEEELGDLLFSLVNYARFLEINPELALRKSIEKFVTRFKHIEKELKKEGKDIRDSTLSEMDAMWDRHKKNP